jgi:hypothetical protein
MVSMETKTEFDKSAIQTQQKLFSSINFSIFYIKNWIKNKNSMFSKNEKFQNLNPFRPLFHNKIANFSLPLQ